MDFVSEIPNSSIPFSYRKNTDLVNAKFQSRVITFSSQLEAQISMNSSLERKIKKLITKNEVNELQIKDKTASENALKVKLACMERELLDCRKFVETKNNIIQRLASSCNSASKAIKFLDVKNRKLSEMLKYTDSEDKILEDNSFLRMEILRLKRILHSLKISADKKDAQVQTFHDPSSELISSSSDCLSSDVFDELSLSIHRNSSSSENPLTRFGSVRAIKTGISCDTESTLSQWGGSVPAKSKSQKQITFRTSLKSISDPCMLSKRNKNAVKNKISEKLNKLPNIKKRTKNTMQCQGNNNNCCSNPSIHNFNNLDDSGEALAGRYEFFEINEPFWNEKEIGYIDRQSILESISILTDHFRQSEQVFMQSIEVQIANLTSIY